ncbi:MAG: hypothetical protein EOO23_07210 [Comamonadaceae bacterium]|nr:MAG: hypothetical protein EOO23_07210 [Comamonadaceae bacterium]
MAAFVGLTVLWLLALMVLPRPVESNWIAGIYVKKEAAASSVQGPKMVIVGGSGSHFSYSARIVGEMTGLSVVNLATHAGLGGEYILHRARESLKAGDTAILALEEQLLFPGKPSSVLATFVLTNDPGYLMSAPIMDVPWLLFGYAPVDVLRQAAATSVPPTSPLYHVETVTMLGDESINTPGNKLPYMLQIVRSLPAISLPAPDPSRPPEYLVSFVAWAKAHNIRLIQAWPATTYRAVYMTAAYDGHFNRYEQTYERLGVEVLRNARDVLVPEEEMLDSLYHADSVGAARVSTKLALDLCRTLQCGAGSAPRR